MLPLDLTIVIPVLNEEKNLPGCLSAIGEGFAKDIVLVDSGSNDSTRDIAKRSGVKVVDFVWNGQFPKKRNWFLRNHTPLTKWVLFLDADEYLTQSFKGELQEALSKEDKVGYWLNYTIYFLGQKMNGGYPLKKLALFKIGAGEYERIDEKEWSKLDMEVHEHPILVGDIGKISSKIDHLDFRGVSHYMNKHIEYANWEASRFLTKLNDSTKQKMTWKQKIKYVLMQSPLIGIVYFFGSFFMLGGFRDGGRGLSFAIFKMAYFTQVYCRIQELKMEQKNEHSV